MRHAACLPARMGGGGKTGIDALGAGQRAQPATRGRLFRFGEREGKALGVPARIALRSSQKRHPCNGAKLPGALRARKCASGRSAMREARVPAGQRRRRRTLRSAQRGTECDCQSSRSTSAAPDRYPNGPGLQARSASADRAWSPAWAARRLHLPALLHLPCKPAGHERCKVFGDQYCVGIQSL